MDNISDKEVAEIFREHVTHKETGRIISKRFNVSYLEKHQKELLDQIMRRTSFIDDTFTIRERLFFLDRGITKLHQCIVCDQVVHPQFYDGWHKATLNDVCSKACWNKHPNKSEMLKEACKHRDEESAKVKRAATMKERFGVEYTLQREDQKEKLRTRFKNASNATSMEKLRNIEWVHEEYITKNRFLIDIADELGCHCGTVADWVRRHGFEVRQTYAFSQMEVEVREYVNSLGHEYIQNTKRVLGDGTEIDIFIPSKNIGIEMNGVFWHSFGEPEDVIGKNYHLTKTNEAKLVGVQLLHFWCTEWSQKREIVKSIIRTKLGCIENKIYARKCQLVELSAKEAESFFMENHLSGHSRASYYVGLSYNDKIVHVMSFGKARYSMGHDYELIRSASLINTSVIGGVGKCMKFFIKTYCVTGDKIISYADKRYATGDSYVKTGFKYIGDSLPGYWWVMNKKIYHRSKFMKKELHRHLVNFDPTQSEATNMFAHKYRRLWDCGNMKFEYII